MAEPSILKKRHTSSSSSATEPIQTSDKTSEEQSKDDSNYCTFVASEEHKNLHNKRDRRRRCFMPLDSVNPNQLFCTSHIPVGEISASGVRMYCQYNQAHVVGQLRYRSHVYKNCQSRTWPVGRPGSQHGVCTAPNPHIPAFSSSPIPTPTTNTKYSPIMSVILQYLFKAVNHHARKHKQNSVLARKRAKDKALSRSKKDRGKILADFLISEYGINTMVCMHVVCFFVCL